MSRRGALVLTLLALAACRAGEPIPETDLRLRVEVGSDPVDLGRAFPLTVVRTWSKDLVPDAWDERQLAPLRLRLEERTLREDEWRREETFRYSGYAFGAGTLVVSPPKLVARPLGGGEAHVVRADGLRLVIRPALDAHSDPVPEPPGDPVREPVSRTPWILLAALLSTAGMVAFVRHARRVKPSSTPDVPAAPFVSPASRALARLRRLRAGASRDPGRVASDVVDTSTVVRDYLGERAGASIDVRTLTTEELLAHLASAAPARGADLAVDRLAELLGGSDRVKFAAHPPTPSERDRSFDRAEEFVRATASGDETLEPVIAERVEGGAP